MLKKWVSFKFCKKRDLESLVGQLHDASIVVRSGRTFIRRLIDLLKSSYHRPSHSFVRLNVEARSDILWWHTFIEHWNGLSMMQQARKGNPDIILTSDASGSWGCGAFSDAGWFQQCWSSNTCEYHITAKELIPIVIAMAVWGCSWTNKSILCRCDNEAVVSILNTGTSKDPTVMGLMRCLHFIAAKFNLLISAVHLAGKANSLADALSRNNLAFFLIHYPQAKGEPATIPAALLDLLLYTKPDWTSRHWSEMFNSIFSQHLLATQCGHTPRVTGDTAISAPEVEPSHTRQLKRPCANLFHTSDGSTSSTPQLRATSLVSDSSKLCKPIRTPSAPTCLGSTTFSVGSNARKQRKVAHNDNASQ